MVLAMFAYFGGETPLHSLVQRMAEIEYKSSRAENLSSLGRQVVQKVL